MQATGRTLPATPEAALRVARIVAGAVVVGPLLVLAVAAWMPPIPALDVLLLPAVVLGLATFAGGLALHARLIRAGRPDMDLAQRAARFHLATLVALALTEAAAILGAMAFSAKRAPWALVPVAAHLALAFLVWPTRSRFDRAFGAGQR